MIMWNRLRYTVWAPAYDAIARAAGFDTARRLSIDRLRLTSGDRVLIVGAGTGLDLDFLPSNVDVTAIDVTPAMLKQLERRAAGTGPRAHDLFRIDVQRGDVEAVVGEPHRERPRSAANLEDGGPARGVRPDVSRDRAEQRVLVPTHRLTG